MRLKEEKKEEEKVIVEVLEDTEIPGTDYILEKGDKIEVIPKKED